MQYNQLPTKSQGELGDKSMTCIIKSIPVNMERWHTSGKSRLQDYITRE